MRPLDDALADNTRRELADFLQARDLPPKLEALRRKALAGLLERPPPPAAPLFSAPRHSPA